MLDEYMRGERNDKCREQSRRVSLCRKTSTHVDNCLLASTCPFVRVLPLPIFAFGFFTFLLATSIMVAETVRLCPLSLLLASMFLIIFVGVSFVDSNVSLSLFLQ